MLEQSKKISAIAMEFVNVADALVHKKGVFAVFQLSDEAMAIQSLDVKALAAEVASMPAKDYAVAMAESCKAKLAMENKAVEAKIKAALDLAAKAVASIARAVDAGKEVVAVAQEAKQLFQ